MRWLIGVRLGRFRRVRHRRATQVNAQRFDEGRVRGVGGRARIGRRVEGAGGGKSTIGIGGEGGDEGWASGSERIERRSGRPRSVEKGRTGGGRGRADGSGRDVKG